MIKKCGNVGCNHAFQDKEYNGMRVVNQTKDGGYRCTVCGKDARGISPKGKK